MLHINTNILQFVSESRPGNGNAVRQNETGGVLLQNS